MRTSPHSKRGVTLIEGLISTVILLVGMVGVLQGLAIASVQNSMANRHTRASTIAQQTLAAIEQQGRARVLVGAVGLFVSPQCVATMPAAVVPFAGDLTPIPPSLVAQGFLTANMCFIDFDALAATYRAITPGYSAQDDRTYQRVIAVYRHPTDPSVTYVGINVGWRDGGQVRVVKRFTALYDTTTNQTNLDF
jgi:hypothetical protein